MAGKDLGAWRFPVSGIDPGLCGCLFATDLFACGAAVNCSRVGVSMIVPNAFRCTE